jgi:PAS domain S-box-containing protein
LFINPAGVAMFGATSAEEIVGRSPLDFSHAAERQSLVTRSSQVLSSKVNQQSLRRRRLRMDGSEYLADVCAMPIVWRGAAAVLVVVRDVTEQVRASDELRRSNAELEQFAYVASHDLQEPLRTVASYCQLLERRCKTQLDGQALEYLGFAVEGAKRMQRLITDLLAFSRVGTKEQPFAPTELNTIFAHAMANLDGAIANSVAKVTCDPLPTVDADGVQLTQLFQNLIGNAIKFRGEAPPVVHLSAEGEGEARVFSVSDNGIGIAPHHRERIFQIFQRLHERGKYEGTGIGLAVCKKIVERHGGRIWIEDAPGGGCAFRFTLPGATA